MAQADIDVGAQLMELELARDKARNNPVLFMQLDQKIRDLKAGRPVTPIQPRQTAIDEDDPWLNVPRYSPNSMDAAAMLSMEGYPDISNPDYDPIDWAGLLPEGLSERAAELGKMWNDPEYARERLGMAADALKPGDGKLPAGVDVLGAGDASLSALEALDLLTNGQPGMTGGVGMSPDDTLLPPEYLQDSGDMLEWDDSMLPPAAEEVETVTDAYGNSVTPEVNDNTIRDLTQQDSGRGGQAFEWNPNAEHDVGRVTPVDEDRFGGGIRKKIGSFFGHDSEEELERFGSALLGFGSGLLTGGPDFGEALGRGFAKAGDQFVATKKSQRQAALDDLKVAREEERLDMEREKMNDWRRKAALERLGEDDPALRSLKREVELKKQGFDKDEDGNWIYTGGADNLPSDYVEYRQTVDAIMANNPGMTRAEAEITAKEILGIKKYDTGFNISE